MNEKASDRTISVAYYTHCNLSLAYHISFSSNAFFALSECRVPFSVIARTENLSKILTPFVAYYSQIQSSSVRRETEARTSPSS